MGEFPSRQHQFKGGERAGKPRPLVGKRRASKLRLAAAEAAIIHGAEAEVFAGDSRDFLTAIMRGAIQPNPTQLAAAMALLKIEHPSLQAVAQVDGRGRISLESIVAESYKTIEQTVVPGIIDLSPQFVGTPALPAPSNADRVVGRVAGCTTPVGTFAHVEGPSSPRATVAASTPPHGGYAPLPAEEREKLERGVQSALSVERSARERGDMGCLLEAQRIRGELESQLNREHMRPVGEIRTDAQGEDLQARRVREGHAIYRGMTARSNWSS